jgi:hypothetical protein
MALHAAGYPGRRGGQPPGRGRCSIQDGQARGRQAALRVVTGAGPAAAERRRTAARWVIGSGGSAVADAMATPCQLRRGQLRRGQLRRVDRVGHGRVPQSPEATRQGANTATKDRQRNVSPSRPNLPISRFDARGFRRILWGAGAARPRPAPRPVSPRAPRSRRRRGGTRPGMAPNRGAPAAKCRRQPTLGAARFESAPKCAKCYDQAHMTVLDLHHP